MKDKKTNREGSSNAQQEFFALPMPDGTSLVIREATDQQLEDAITVSEKRSQDALAALQKAIDAQSASASVLVTLKYERDCRQHKILLS